MGQTTGSRDIHRGQSKRRHPAWGGPEPAWENRLVRGPGSDQQAEPAEAMRARVRASFARQAMMATLGAELVSVERGQVELALPKDERFTQQHGFVHAGAVAAVLDRACGYAAYSVMPPEAAVLTASYTINLLAPAAGERFRMTGTVVRAGRTLVVCRGDAFADAAAVPFAVMQATLTALYDRPGIQH
jgi:uncharacterized protein (TIGR00369 family)